MRHWLLMLVLTVSISACGPGGNSYVLDETSESESSPSDSEAAENDRIGLPSIEVIGLDVTLYKEIATDSTKQRPSFRILAKTGDSDENTNYTLTNPRAIIYDKDGEEIVITADSGDFDQTKKIANLADNVILTTGDKQIKMNTITWENGPGIAYTEDGATLTSDTANLVAESLTLMPSTSKYRMEVISGTIKLKEVH